MNFDYGLLQDIGFEKLAPASLFCDDKATMHIVANPFTMKLQNIELMSQNWRKNSRGIYQDPIRKYQRSTGLTGFY